MGALAMFSLIGRHIHVRRTAIALASAAIMMGAVPALAEACTPSTSGTQVLKPFGDSNLYSLAPGGSFESATNGWTLNGSSVQSGNESYKVNGSSHSHSLLVPATSQPVSAPICVSSATPYFRFFAKQAGSGWSEMNINVLWTDSSGSHVTTAGGLSPTTSWGLTQSYNLGAMLGPVFQPGITLSVRLQFVPASGGAPIAIDDIEVDPYSK